MRKLIVLHAHTMNAAVMREHLGELVAQLERETELAFVDAPHTATKEAVDHLYTIWNAPRHAPPHHTYWVSSEDGREYRGWEETRERVREAMGDGDGEIGFLGFSQGAILSAAIAALGEHGEMPAVRFAIMVAGRTPRADVLQRVFAKPLRTPSLHMWGANDKMAGNLCEELSTRFDAATREVVIFDGDHHVPTCGEGAEAILRFVRKHG